MKKLLAVALFLPALAAHAVDGVSLDLGKGDRETSLVRLGVHWNYELLLLAPHDVHAYIEVSVARWTTQPSALYDTAITPVFRYARRRNGPYAEGAVGLHILSSKHIQRDLEFSTRFQFGDHIGVGVRSGPYDI